MKNEVTIDVSKMRHPEEPVFIVDGAGHWHEAIGVGRPEFLIRSAYAKGLQDGLKRAREERVKTIPVYIGILKFKGNVQEMEVFPTYAKADEWLKSRQGKDYGHQDFEGSDLRPKYLEVE